LAVGESILWYQRVSGPHDPFVNRKLNRRERVKVLYIADNFGNDWVNLGYPVVMGR